MRLIDADVLKTKILECSKNAYCYGTFVEYYKGKVVAYENAVDLIDGAPIIEERKHGHWRIEPYLLEKTGCCSICGEQIRMPHEIYKYCPNCGARMDGDEE